MKPIDFGQILAHRQLDVVGNRVVVGFELLDIVGDHFVGALELAGEAHDVDQGRAKIVADDIGEALDFVIGAGEVGGALDHRAFKIGVEQVKAIADAGQVTGIAPHQPGRADADHDQQDAR